MLAENEYKAAIEACRERGIMDPFAKRPGRVPTP